MADDANEIQVAAEHFLSALDNLDWEQFVGCWSSDPSAFYPGDDTRVDGHTAVLTRFRTMFDQIPLRAPGPPYLQLKPRNLRINRYGDAGLSHSCFPTGPVPHPSGLCSLSGSQEHGNSPTSTPPIGYSCELGMGSVELRLWPLLTPQDEAIDVQLKWTVCSCRPR